MKSEFESGGKGRYSWRQASDLQGRLVAYYTNPTSTKHPKVRVLSERRVGTTVNFLLHPGRAVKPVTI